MLDSNDFSLEKYYDIYRRLNLFDEMFIDFSIKQYEAEILVSAIKQKRPTKILIIGAFKGLSTLIALLENPNQQCQIHCIDPFFDNYYAGDNYRNAYDRVIQEFDSRVQVSTIKGFATTPGQEVMNLTKDSSMFNNPNYWFRIDELETGFDLIFIDGDHSYETALTDFVKSFKILSPEGIVLIHDTCDKLWKDGLTKLLTYIRFIPGLKLTEHHNGINGMAVVEKILN